MNNEATNDVRAAWGRVVAWLEQNAPVTAAKLAAPATPEMIMAAEERMETRLPSEMRRWLQVNDGCVYTPEENVILPQDYCAFTPDGWALLCLDRVEFIYHHNMWFEKTEPSPDDPDAIPFWSPTWVPFSASSDALYGYFVDATTGEVGKWSDYGERDLALYPSLTAYFSHVADLMDEVPQAGMWGPRVVEGQLSWST